MRIEGKITNVINYPIIEGKNGKTYKKAEAIVEVPISERYTDTFVATVIRSMGDIQPGWQDVIFGWTAPVDVVMLLAFDVEEYNGRRYQRCKAVECREK